MWRSAQVRVALATIALVAACEHPQPTRPSTTTPTSGAEADRSGHERQLEATTETASTPSSYRFETDDLDGEVAQGGAGDVAETTVASPPPPPSSPMPVVASEASPQSYDEPMSLSVGTSTTTGTTTIDLPNIGGYVAREPSPIELMGYTLAPSVPTRVLLATLELPPGERFVPPVSSCQDTLLYVASGTLDASGTGIASVDAPATLYAGDAVRFGPEGDGLVINASSETVRTIIALARSEDGGPARIALDERGDRVLCPDHGGSDPLSQPQRVASFATSPPLMAADGALEVRILLDADAAGAEHAGLAILSASSTFAVPEHTHDAAAEILYFEDGQGTMHIGDQSVDIAPGVSVYVPEATPHSFEPSGARPMRALQFYAPSGPEQRFRGIE